MANLVFIIAVRDCSPYDERLERMREIAVSRYISLPETRLALLQLVENIVGSCQKYSDLIIGLVQEKMQGMRGSSEVSLTIIVWGYIDVDRIAKQIGGLEPKLVYPLGKLSLKRLGGGVWGDGEGMFRYFISSIRSLKAKNDLLSKHAVEDIILETTLADLVLYYLDMDSVFLKTLISAAERYHGVKTERVHLLD